jgi:hypothetical protein
MSCPLFEDYTRGCIKEFSDLVAYSNFDVCDSKEYKKCPLYIMVNSKFKCQYFQTCLHAYYKGIPNFIEKLFLDEKFKGDIIVCLTKKYCSSEDNYMNCARYMFVSHAEEPPLTLFSDDRVIHLAD